MSRYQFVFSCDIVSAWFLVRYRLSSRVMSSQIGFSCDVVSAFFFSWDVVSNVRVMSFQIGFSCDAVFSHSPPAVVSRSRHRRG